MKIKIYLIALTFLMIAGRIYCQSGEKESINHYIERINRAISDGNFQKSITLIDKALKIDSLNAGLYFVKATMYQNLNLIDEALSCYYKSLDVDPNYYDTYYSLGSYYYNSAIENNDSILKRNNFERSLNYFYKAKVINPNETILIEIINSIEKNLE